MTTEQPTQPRLLRRRSDDRVIGGVASGLGDYFNVDPLLIRIGFVGLMVFGGLGLLLYVAAWLLVPDDTSDRSIVEEWLHHTPLTANPWIILLLFVAALIVFVGGIGGAYASSELAAAFGLALLVVIIGGLLLSSSRGSVTTAPPVAAAQETVTAPRQAVERPRRQPRPRSPLGWYVMGGVLLAIGVVALLSNVAAVEVELSQYFGLALAVIGIGLVIGTWWGHARSLILLGLLLLPFAYASTFVTAPLEGGLGFHRFDPVNADEVRPEYRLLGGRMELDLREITQTSEPIEIAASVAAGEMHVLLPRNANVVADAEVGAGELGLIDEWRRGTGLVDRVVREGDGPTFHLDLELGIGSLWLDGLTREDR